MLSYQTGRSWLKLVVLNQLWGLIQRLPILQFAPRLLKHQGNNKELVMHNLRLHIHITPLSHALLLILHSDPSPPLSCCRLSEISTKAWGAGLGLHPHALRGLALVGGALELGMNALSFHAVVFLTLCFFFAGNSGLNYSRSDLDYDGWISYVNNFP